MAQVRDLVRVKHYGIKAEQGYLGWVKDGTLNHQTRPPGDEE